MLVGLFLVFGGGAHYAALVLGWKRQREFVDRYIRQARRAAWGDELGVRGIPGVDATGGVPAPTPDAGDAGAAAMPMNRRQKRMMERENRKEKKAPRASSRGSGTATPTTESVEPTGERKRVVAENGKVLIVDSVGNVFLEEESEDGERQEFLLDVEEIPRPTMRDTMVFRLPGWVFRKTVGRVFGSSDAVEEEDSPEAAESAGDEPTTSSSAMASNGKSSRRRGRRSQKS